MNTIKLLTFEEDEKERSRIKEKFHEEINSFFFDVIHAAKTDTIRIL